MSHSSSSTTLQITWRIKPVFNKRDLKKIDEYRVMTQKIMETEQQFWPHTAPHCTLCIKQKMSYPTHSSGPGMVQEVLIYANWPLFA
eukprot:1159148-Pelagomonas_calceolata.AAC.1